MLRNRHPILTTLLLAVSLSLLSACSATGKRVQCQPVPAQWTKVPPKPTAEGLEVGKTTNRDIAGKLYALDQWGEQMAGRLENIERHQAPCRR
jgi:hypothetical protein